MNVAKFQLVLNHDDLDVISKGLQEFSLLVLKDHDAEETFGYNGRNRHNNAAHVLTPTLPGNVNGLLHAYLSSSPQIEEIFIVWSLVDRSNYTLCAALNRCVAVILHCAQSLENICNDIVNRILHEFWRNITANLDSNNAELVHSCLSLLIAMSRTSKNNCDQVSQKLNFGDTVYTSMIQKGKTKQTGLFTPAEQPVLVDSRILLIILIFTLIMDANEAGVERILASNSIVKKIMHGLTKDIPVSLELILNAVLFMIRRSSVIRSHLLDIIDAGCIDKLLSLYQSEDSIVQAIVERFLNQLVELLTHLLQSSDSHASVVRSCLLNVIKLLKPQKDKLHRQLQVDILNVVPFYLSHSINGDGFVWSGSVNGEYTSMLVHLAEVLTITPLDAKQKDTLRQKFSAWDSLPKKSQGQQIALLVQELMNSLLPSGLTKGEITKLLSHPSTAVTVAVLKLVRAVLARLQRLLSDAGIGRGLFQRVTSSSLFFKWLPEMNALLDVTLKSVKNGHSESNDAVVTEATPVESSVDDFDFNFLGDGTQRRTAVMAQSSTPMDEDELNTSEVASASTVREISLEVMALYASLFAASGSTAGGDVLKLLNDTVAWSADTSAVDTLASVEASVSPQLLSGILVVLKKVASSVGWFSNRNDVSKLLAAVVQLKGMSTVHQQSLSKLLLLCSSEQELSNDGVGLLKQVLLGSGLFEGHGKCEFELHCELQCWLQLASVSPANVPLLSTLLMTAYHYSADLCCSLGAFSEATSMSSLSMALLLLSIGEFKLFSSDFPKQLQVSLASSSIVDFEQRELFQTLVEGWMNIVLKHSPCAFNYLSCFKVALEAQLSGKKDSELESFASTVFKYMELLSVAQSAPVDGQKTLLHLSDNAIGPQLKSVQKSGVVLLAYAALNLVDLVDIKPETNVITSKCHELWQLVCMLHLTASGEIKPAVLNFMKKKWNSDLSLAASSYTKQLLIHNALVLAQCLLSSNSATVTSNGNTANKKKRKKPTGDEEPEVDSSHMAKEFCNQMVEGLKTVLNEAAASQSVSSVLSNTTNARLMNQFLENTPFGEWCCQVLLTVAEACVGTKQSLSLKQSLWNSVTDGLARHFSQDEVTPDPILIKLCVVVYKCVGSIELRLVLSRVGPSALAVIDSTIDQVSSFNTAGELKKNHTSISEASSQFIELCAQPVKISESTGLVESILSFTKLDDDCFDRKVLIPSVASIVKKFTNGDKSNNDVDATLRFMQSGFPLVFGASSLSLLPINKEVKVLSQTYPLLTAAVTVVCGSSYDSAIESEDLSSLFESIVLPSAKGKLCTALQGLSALMITVHAGKSLAHSVKLVGVEFLRQYLTEYRHFHDRVLLDDMLLLPLLKLRSVIDTLELSGVSELWIRAVSAVLKLYLSVNSNLLIKTQSYEKVKFKMQVQRVQKMLSVADSTCPPVVQDLTAFSELNKWVKCCLKFEMDNDLVLNILMKLMGQLIFLPLNSLLRTITATEKDLDGNALDSPVLFNMIAGHSKLGAVLLGHDQEAKLALLRLLVFLLRYSMDHSRVSEIKESAVFLAGLLWSQYKGTTSALDQTKLRFFQLLEHDKKHFTVCLQHMRIGAALNAETIAGENLTETWLFDFMSPPMVYTTLSNFVVTRGVESSPFPWETNLVGEVASENAVGGSGYDIAYMLPVIFSTLRNFDVSIRRLTNCGAVSIVMLGLASGCSTARSYALASLHLIFLLLHKQTPEVDPSFRERSQLLHLMGWLKNSIMSMKERKIESSEVPSVAPIIGIFLGRAVLNIMQSNHELYSVINKYLLNRPWCDMSDVPLLDFLLNQSDSQTHVSERLAVLRLLRDGLISSQDHSNLCRKNGYSRLMLMFCIHSTDVRIGYAILDVIERGLLIKQSAKYLLERCDVLSWLHATAVNPSSKFRIKALTMLRSVIGYSYIALLDGSVQEGKLVQCVILSVVETFVVNSESSSSELIRLILLCMWDLKLMFTDHFDEWTDGLLLKLREVAARKEFSDEVLHSILALASPSAASSVEDSKALLTLVLGATESVVLGKTDEGGDGKGPYDNLKNHSSEENLWFTHYNFPYKSSTRFPCTRDITLLLSCCAHIVERCTETLNTDLQLLKWAVKAGKSVTIDDGTIQNLSAVVLRGIVRDNSVLDWIQKPADRANVKRLAQKLLEATRSLHGDNKEVVLHIFSLSLQFGHLGVSWSEKCSQWSDFNYATHAASAVQSWMEKVELVVKNL